MEGRWQHVGAIFRPQHLSRHVQHMIGALNFRTPLPPSLSCPPPGIGREGLVERLSGIGGVFISSVVRLLFGRLCLCPKDLVP